MSPWLWVCIALALLILLLLTRAKLRVQYDGDGGRVTVGFGLVTVPIYPMEKKQPGEQKRKKAKKSEKKEASGGGSVVGFRELTSIILNLAGRIRRRLCIDELTLWYQSAAKDPAAAALSFGAANAAAGLLLQPLEKAFRVKKRDVRTAVSFTETRPSVIACLRLSMPLWAILYLGAAALIEWKKARKRAADTEE